jgi:NADH dehydrogenase
MATIGASRAVAQIGWLRFAGFAAWLAWLFVHLMQLVGFQNRLLVFIQWAWNYWTRNRAARLITDTPLSDDAAERSRLPAENRPAEQLVR